jgi:hypothetical protein
MTDLKLPLVDYRYKLYDDSIFHFYIDPASILKIQPGEYMTSHIGQGNVIFYKNTGNKIVRGIFEYYIDYEKETPDFIKGYHPKPIPPALPNLTPWSLFPDNHGLF